MIDLDIWQSPFGYLQVYSQKVDERKLKEFESADLCNDAHPDGFQTIVRALALGPIESVILGSTQIYNHIRAFTERFVDFGYPTPRIPFICRHCCRYGITTRNEIWLPNVQNCNLYSSFLETLLMASVVRIYSADKREFRANAQWIRSLFLFSIFMLSLSPYRDSKSLC